MRVSGWMLSGTRVATPGPDGLPLASKPVSG